MEAIRIIIVFYLQGKTLLKVEAMLMQSCDGFDYASCSSGSSSSVCHSDYLEAFQQLSDAVSVSHDLVCLLV